MAELDAHRPIGCAKANNNFFHGSGGSPTIRNEGFGPLPGLVLLDADFAIRDRMSPPEKDPFSWYGPVTQQAGAFSNRR